MKQWEYLVEHVSLDDPFILQNLLDGFGNAGWELVAVIESTGHMSTVLYFKRPVA